MKAHFALGALSLALSAAGEDILFPQLTPRFHLKSNEWARAQALNMTAKLVTLDEWANMTTDDFAQFKAIVIADNPGQRKDTLKFLVDSQEIWSPAVVGNMMLIGTDPSNHCCKPGQGPEVLIDNALKFCANGTWPDGTPQTGLYFALSQYYDSAGAPEVVETLSEFGVFTARGQLGCYDDVHIVATSSALGNLGDDDLSNWACSIHEVFVTYPPEFQALAIGENVRGVGNDTFGDGTSGVPYIISRGATPAGCGDGNWDQDLGEECDDGNTDDGDGCDKSCRCEAGFRADGKGTCVKILPTSSVVNTTSVVSTSSMASTSGLTNATSSATTSREVVPTPSEAPATSSESELSREVPTSSEVPATSSEVPATSSEVPATSSEEPTPSEQPTPPTPSEEPTPFPETSSTVTMTSMVTASVTVTESITVTSSNTGCLPLPASSSTFSTLTTKPGFAEPPEYGETTHVAIY